MDGLVQLESVGQNGSSPVPLGLASFDQTGSIATIPVLATLGTGNYQVVLAGSDFYGSPFPTSSTPRSGIRPNLTLWIRASP